MSSNFFLQDAYLYICSTIFTICFFYLYGHHPYLHVLTHSFPTRRSSDLGPRPAQRPGALVDRAGPERIDDDAAARCPDPDARCRRRPSRRRPGRRARGHGRPVGVQGAASPRGSRRPGQRAAPPTAVERRPRRPPARADHHAHRSEEHTSELQSLMRSSYAVFCLKKKKEDKTYEIPTK